MPTNNNNFNPRGQVDFSSVNTGAGSIGGGLTRSNDMNIASIGSSLNEVQSRYAQQRQNHLSGLQSGLANTAELADLARTQTQQAMAGQGVLTESGLQRADRGVQQQTANTIGDIQNTFRANIEFDEFNQKQEIRSNIDQLLGSPELEGGLVAAGFMEQGDDMASFTDQGLDYMLDLGYGAADIGSIMRTSISGEDDEYENNPILDEEIGNLIIENGGGGFRVDDNQIMVGDNIIDTETGEVKQVTYDSWLEDKNLKGLGDSRQENLYDNFFDSQSQNLTDAQKIMIVSHANQEKGGDWTDFFRTGSQELTNYFNSSGFKTWYEKNIGAFNSNFDTIPNNIHSPTSPI